MRTKSLLPIDELNVLNTYLESKIQVGDKDEIEVFDEIFDLLVIAYANGYQSVRDDLGMDISGDIQQLDASINKEIAGKTWKDRVSEYLKTDDTESIKRVIDTETHRVYNEAQFDAAKQSGEAVSKTWATMLDDRVRDTHEFLEGVKVPLNSRFYVGDSSTLYPGGFGVPELDINCRCELIYSRE